MRALTISSIHFRKQINLWKGLFLITSFLLVAFLNAQEAITNNDSNVSPIAFEDLPDDLKAKYVDIRDQVSFLKMVVSPDGKGKLTHGDVLDVEPEDIHSVDVYKDKMSIFISIKKEGEYDLPQSNGEWFRIVEEKPKFPGGMEAFSAYIQKEISFPKKAHKEKSVGKVDVSFVIDKEGSITNIEVSKGIQKSVQKEIKRVLENVPSFQPGKQRGKAVRTRMSLPLTFKLNGDSLNPDGSPKGIVIVGEASKKDALMKVDAKFKKGKWTGKVVDEDGNPMIGANIVVAGTTTGTVSDIDGKFEVKANKDQRLHISFVGYESVEIER